MSAGNVALWRAIWHSTQNYTYRNVLPIYDIHEHCSYRLKNLMDINRGVVK